MYALLTGGKGTLDLNKKAIVLSRTHTSVCYRNSVSVYPFYSLTEVETQGMVMNGTTAFIDPRYKERSFAESKLVEIIPQCWIYDPRQRINIFRIVDFLRNAVQESKRY